MTRLHDATLKAWVLLGPVLFGLGMVACRGPYPETETATSPVPPAAQATSYRDLIEASWVPEVSDTTPISFESFSETIQMNRQPGEDEEDIYAIIHSIATNYAFNQGAAPGTEHFLVAASCSSWWHPPGSPPAPSLETWEGMRPDLIEAAFEDAETRLQATTWIDPTIYTLDPDVALDLLEQEGSGACNLLLR